MKELLTVIVPAAGAGRRMGLGKNKAFVTVGGMPLLVLCLKMLAETRMVRRIIVAVRDWEIAYFPLFLYLLSHHFLRQLYYYIIDILLYLHIFHRGS